MTQNNAVNSESAAEFMADAAARVEEANGTVDVMLVSIRDINTLSDTVAKISKVIDEIAFQTNILALNAAVEAARAGETGWGLQWWPTTKCAIEESIAKSNDAKSKLDRVTGAIGSIT
jgi:methyl-accepting chemotaxis protein